MPRQMPSTGMSRSSARRASASSKRSRSGQVPSVSRVRLGAVAGRVDVGAAGQHQRVEPVEQHVGVLGRARRRAAGSAPAPPARCTARA